VVPETASAAKIDALRESGSELMLIGKTYDEAEIAGRRLAGERGAVFVSAYNDAAVVAGGGTVALEILDDLPVARCLIVPAGGGGLIGGIGIAAAGRMVYGAQSVASPALHAALRAGRLVQVPILDSLADGLAGNVEAGSMTFDLLQQHVRDIALVEEADVADAMRFLVEHERVLVEGAAAVGVAALLRQKLPIDGPTVVVLTGRNVSASVLRELVLQ
jgi:threonine dehydratase